MPVRTARLTTEVLATTGENVDRVQTEGTETAAMEEVLLLINAATGFNNLSRYRMF